MSLALSSTTHNKTAPLKTLNNQRWIFSALLFIALIALALRIQNSWHRINQISDSYPYLQLGGDEIDYETLAHNLLQGSFFEKPWRVPVYPMFIAAIYLILGERSAEGLLYIQAFVGVAPVLLTFFLARRVTKVLPALAAAGMVALDTSLIDHSKLIYSEILYTPLLLISLLTLLWAVESPRLSRFAWAGATMAIVTLCRPTSALIPLILPFLLPRAWNIKKKLFAFLIYGSSMVAIIAPWTCHNWRQHGRFLPLSVSSGVTLWQGSPEFYHLTKNGRNQLDIYDEELNPERNGGHDPKTIEGDQYFRRLAIRSILAEPHVYLEYSLKKAAYLWFGSQAAGALTYFDLYDWKELREWASFSLPKLIGMFVVGQMPLVALVAVLILCRLRRLRPLKPFILVCGYFTIIHMITWPEIRYSSPLHPLLAVIIAVAAFEVVEWKRHRKKSLRCRQQEVKIYERYCC